VWRGITARQGRRALPGSVSGLSNMLARPVARGVVIATPMTDETLCQGFGELRCALHGVAR